jgi:alkylation response protein AidB-like acyl-CoA dehydrogenase
MDLSWSDEQLELRDSIVKFAQKELNHDMVARDAEARFPRDLWVKCAEVGLHGLPVTEEYGGQGADPLTIVLALEALGYGCRDNGLIFSLNAQMWSAEMPIQRFGNESRSSAGCPGCATARSSGSRG